MTCYWCAYSLELNSGTRDFIVMVRTRRRSSRARLVAGGHESPHRGVLRIAAVRPICDVHNSSNREEEKGENERKNSRGNRSRRFPMTQTLVDVVQRLASLLAASLLPFSPSFPRRLRRASLPLYSLLLIFIVDCFSFSYSFLLSSFSFFYDSMIFWYKLKRRKVLGLRS